MVNVFVITENVLSSLSNCYLGSMSCFLCFLPAYGNFPLCDNNFVLNRLFPAFLVSLIHSPSPRHSCVFIFLVDYLIYLSSSRPGGRLIIIPSSYSSSHVHSSSLDTLHLFVFLHFFLVIYKLFFFFSSFSLFTSYQLYLFSLSLNIYIFVSP